MNKKRDYDIYVLKGGGAMKYTGLITFSVGFLVGAYCIGEYSGKLLEKKQKTISELYEDKKFLSDWLEMEMDGKSIAYYICKKGYKEIAIYGMGFLGRRLLDALMDTEVHVKYAVDKSADLISDMVDIKKPSDELEHVDAMIVTAVPFYDEIRANLCDEVNFPIVSIKEFLAPEYGACN